MAYDLRGFATYYSNPNKSTFSNYTYFRLGRMEYKKSLLCRKCRHFHMHSFSRI